MIVCHLQHNFSYGPVVFSVYKADLGQGLGEHEHEHSHILYCSAGRCLVTVGEKSIEMTVDTQPVLVPQDTLHQFEALENGTVILSVVDNDQKDS